VKAVEMAQRDLRGTKYRYEIKIADSGPDPAKARDIVRRVIEDDKVDAVIGAVSLIGQVTKPFATKARIPHACVCTVKPIGDGAYNFTNIPSPEAEAVRWVAEAQRRNVRSIAVIAQDYPSINNHVKAMKAEALRVGLTISYQSKFPDSTRDFRSIIASARATQPDVYYVEALEPGLDLLGQQLLDAKIPNIGSVVAPSVSEHPQLFEGAWYTDSDLADIAFKRRFEAKYPGTQFATHMMPYAYDSFNLIVRAYEQGVNPAVYLRGLTRYVGSAGVVTKAPGSGNFQSKPAVWEIRNGTPALVSSASTINNIARRTQP
jgi:ABC-type branched-subunit amino acid transport system substrate-binding protein